jgi:hypothetical protein
LFFHTILENPLYFTLILLNESISKEDFDDLDAAGLYMLSKSNDFNGFLDY